MAGMIIGKLGFGKDTFFYGLELCLHLAGRSAYPVDERTAGACDVILVTLCWWKDILRLEAFLRKAGIRRGRGKPYLLAGGMQATMTPRLVARMVDAVFVGDGDEDLGALLGQLERGEQPASPHLYRDGDPEVPAPKECQPTAFAMHKGGRRDVVRVEIARGCRYKCRFCAMSGLKSYREVPFDEVRPVLDRASRAPCSLFAPERTRHSEWPKFVEYLDATGRREIGQDTRLDGLDQVRGNSVTFGVEGISQRLRKSIGKGWSDEFILEKLGQYVETRNGVARVSAYFIADLPGEEEEDWATLRALFERIEAENWSRRLTLLPVLNPFSPRPFTKLADAVVHPFRPYGERWSQLLRKDGSQWGFRVVETLVCTPYERAMDAILTRGGAAAYEIVQRLPGRLLTGKPKIVEAPATAREVLREAVKFGLTDEVLRLA